MRSVPALPAAVVLALAPALGGTAAAAESDDVELGFVWRTQGAADLAWDRPREDRLETRTDLVASARGHAGEGRWFLEVRGEHFLRVGAPAEGGDTEAAWGVAVGESGWEGPVGPLRLRAGNLVERWGRLDLLPTLDAWNPRDLRSGLLTPPEAVRVPVPTVGLELGEPAARATLLLGPFPQGDRGTLWGTDWSLVRPGLLEGLLADAATWEGDPLTTELLQDTVAELGARLEELDPSTRRGLVGGLGQQQRPQDLAINGDLALRLATEQRGFDLVLTGANLRSRQPLTEASQTLVAYLQEERLPTYAELSEGLLDEQPLGASWPRTWLVGGDMSTMLGLVGLRLEGAWRSDQVVQRTWLRSETVPSLTSGIGLDYAQGANLLLVLEARWIHLLAPPDALWLAAADQVQTAATLRVSLLAERVVIFPAWIHDWAFDEDLLRAEATWRVSDAWQVSGGVLLLEGPTPPPQDFAAAMDYAGGPLGYVSDNDVATLTLTWIR